MPGAQDWAQSESRRRYGTAGQWCQPLPPEPILFIHSFVYSVIYTSSLLYIYTYVIYSFNRHFRLLSTSLLTIIPSRTGDSDQIAHINGATSLITLIMKRWNLSIKFHVAIYYDSDNWEKKSCILIITSKCKSINFSRFGPKFPKIFHVNLSS